MTTAPAPLWQVLPPSAAGEGVSIMMNGEVIRICRKSDSWHKLRKYRIGATSNSRTQYIASNANIVVVVLTSLTLQDSAITENRRNVVDCCITYVIRLYRYDQVASLGPL